MGKSRLSDEAWTALFAEEKAGAPRRLLAPKYGVKPSAINQQARTRGLTKRETGAPDHRRRPPGGWPPDEPLSRSPVGMTPNLWREAALRRLDGEADAAVAADYGVSVGRLIAVAAALGLRKCDVPNAVYRSRVRVPREGPPPDRATEPDAEAPPARPKLRDAQRPPGPLPDGSDWSTWLFLGGRGAGKTLAGAEWLADQAERLGDGGRLALIGPTLHDVREVMIEGVSGLRSLSRWTARTRPRFEPSRRRLLFANGCVAQAFSAEDPDSLRGPQFSAAWADEFCAWPAVGARGAGETLALLRMGLRLPLPGAAVVGPSGPPDPEPVLGPTEGPIRGRPGAQAASDRVARVSAPKLVVTTTPRPTRALVALRDEPSCVLTHAGTADNAEHLSPGFLDGLRALYGGTRREAQEIEGRIVDVAGALFTAEMMAAARGEAPGQTVPSPLEGEGGSRSESDEGSASAGRLEGADAVHGQRGETPLIRPSGPPSPSRGEGNRVPPLDRIIVALDPTTTATGDACGIIVAGSRRRADGAREAVVLADRSASGLSPDQWGRRAVQAARDFNAGAMVAEVNQGGDMVRAVLKTAGCALRIREVRASKGKRVRAEPVAALYEQGRVRHAPADGVRLSALEEELMAFAGEMEGAGSLDRADALVWAVTDLLIDAPEGERGPRVRWL